MVIYRVEGIASKARIFSLFSKASIVLRNMFLGYLQIISTGMDFLDLDC